MTEVSRRERAPLGLGLVVGGTLPVEGTSLVEGKLLVGGKLLVEGTLLVGGRLPAAGEGTEELTEEGVAVGHTEQAVVGVPEGLSLALEDGVGTGESEAEVTVPEGLAVGGTAESVERGRGVEVGLPAGSVVGVGTGELVMTLMGGSVGEGELAKLSEGTGVGVGVTAEGSATPEGLTTGVTVGAGVMVEDNEVETPEGMPVGVSGVRVVVKPVLSKVDVTSPGTRAGDSWTVSLVITIDSFIMDFGSGWGSRFS